MLYKKALKWLGVLFLSVFVASFLFSYNLSSRGFFDFAQYLEDLRAMATETRDRLAENNSDANGEADQNSDGEDDEGDQADGEDQSQAEQSETSGNDFTEEVHYESLSEHRGQNPYTSFLTDRILVRDMRYLIGPEYYKHLLKSMPNAEVVYYDEDYNIYTVTGSNEVSLDRLSGIVQIKDTGQVYIAYIMNGNIHYHTNDRKYSGELVENRQMDKWIEQNGDNRNIIYFNKG